MKKLTITVITWLVILVLFRCNPSDNFAIKLTSISPDTKVSHMPSFTLTATGSNFDPDSIIVFNGTEKQTTFVSSTELTCQIHPNDIVLGSSGNHEHMISGTMKDKTVPVLVRSRLTGAGDSNRLYFTIRDNYTFNESIRIFDDSSLSSGPRISVDSAGNINVVWTNIVYNPGAPAKTQIYFSRSINDGLNWSQPVNISNPLEYSGSPAFALDSSGNINVVWNDRTPGNLDIYFNRSTDGGETWSQAVNLSDKMDINYSDDIAVDSAGNINVIWSDDSLGQLFLNFRRSTDNGATWSQVVSVSNDIRAPLWSAMALDAAGNIDVVWADIFPGNEDDDIFFASSTR